MDREFLMKVVMPLLGLAMACGIFISTVLRPNDMFSRMLLTPMPDGTFVMNPINITLSVCQMCVSHGRDQCTHAVNNMPHWLDRVQQKRIMRLFSDVRSEMDGILSGGGEGEPAFTDSSIKRLFEQPRRQAQYEPAFVAVGIDPSGGSALSDFSIVSVYKDPVEDTVVVGGGGW
jgi:hypothetical protein